MQLANSPSRYGALPQLVHWLTALFVIAGWLLGTFLDDIPKGPPREFGLLTHMTLGQCVFVLVIVRLIWRHTNPPPPPEKTRYGRLLEILATLNHYALYALLLAVPLLGVIVQLRRGNPMPIFGVGEFASPWPNDRATARTILGIHGFCANTVLILAGVHAAAALVHHHVFRDRTLARMLPGAG
jgi:cytochrome b561